MSEDHIHIKIDHHEDSDKSSENEHYNDVNEKYLRDVKDECTRFAKHHITISKKCEKINFICNFITHSLPLILINLTFFNHFHFEIIQSIFLTISIIINSFNSLKKYERQIICNQTYARKYDDLGTEINKILVRKRSHRQHFDVVLENISLKLLALNDQSF